ncbi:GIY-YIG nuclease family protein [Ignavigranum ruoffiae]|uniref:GIY-YIG nuclease family protein n=1 Tax=Ignavigranum ruoffiae TaxID=89093 RepID=UPI00235709CA|nr:GIY-YIG nuclease family protein [Ignavigranum ruoffiae]
MEREYCVYAHTNKINNKKYIGMSKNIKNRWRQNGVGYKTCPYFYRAIQKYGWENFEHEVIQDNLTHVEACQLEKDLITLYQTRGSGGYNLATGGSSAVTMTYQQRLKQSEYMTRRNSNPKTNPISNGKVIWGVTHSFPTTVRIKVITPEGGEMTFESISECSKHFGISHSQIKRLCYKSEPYELSKRNANNENYKNIVGCKFIEIGRYVSGKRVGESSYEWVERECRENKTASIELCV